MRLTTLFLMLLTLMFGFAVTGCPDDDGPVEDAAEEVEDAAEDAADDVEDAVE